MDNIEKLLNKLPKEKLSLKADITLRLKLNFLIWQKKLIRTGEFKPLFSFPRFATVLGVILLFCLVTILPGFAYANDNILPGNWLYPVKKAVESIQIGLPQSPEKKVAALEKFANRRLDEAEALSSDKNDNKSNDIVKTINEAVELSTDAASIASNLPATTTENNIISISRTDKIEKLSRVASNIGIGQNEILEDTIALAFDRIQNNGKNIRSNKIFNLPNDPAKMKTASTTESYPPKVATSTQNNDQKQEGVTRNWFNKFIKPDKKTPATTTPNDAVNKEMDNSLTKTQDKIDKMETDLKTQSIDQGDYQKLKDRLNEKMQKAHDALKSGNIQGFQGLIQSTEALTNNAKHFIKTKKESVQKTESITINGKNTVTASSTVRATSTMEKFNRTIKRINIKSNLPK